jgi:hypothetical protein
MANLTQNLVNLWAKLGICGNVVFARLHYHYITTTLPNKLKRRQMKKRYGETAERIYMEIQLKKLLEQKKKIIKKKLKQIEKETNK